MKRVMIAATVAVGVGIPTVGELNAECLVPPAPCISLKQSDHVLLGDVLEASSGVEPIDAVQGRIVPQLVSLRVVEAFKGGRAKGQIFELQSDTGPETPFFQVGQRYLVYATSRAGAPWVARCSRTTHLGSSSNARERIAEELADLRRCDAP
jgi:hypothetical protein